VTRATQWGPPPEEELSQTQQHHIASVVNAALPPSKLHSSDREFVDYSAAMSFSKSDPRGTFCTAGSESHWDRVGLPNDRQDRQMGFFADSSKIQAQMAEAAEVKKERQRMLQQGGAASKACMPQWAESTDWKSFNKERKEKKRKLATKALLADGDGDE